MRVAGRSGLRIMLAFGGAFALAGCLFPSLDGLEGAPVPAQDATEPKGRAEQTGAADIAEDARTARDAATPVTADDAAVKTRGTIACGNAQCQVGAEFCCFGPFGPAGCIPNANPVACQGPFAGRAT